MLATKNTLITDTLRDSFTENMFEGFWYPTEPGTPLVRIQVAESGYSIERRRNEQSSWMPIVTAETAEFDPAAFRLWRDRWKMVE